ncbi:MAG: cobyrinate a,c-diamide synthase [Hydrogenophilus sp.]|nr:cobyrinate a,c-diamide synthase [Hydrogenophilus sp.]
MKGFQRTTVGIYLSAARQSSGKTAVAVGLAAYWSTRGRKVQTFKKGPDFIDPSWLRRASGRPCYSLDPYLEPMEKVRERFVRRCCGADMALVEGNMGLFDGMAEDGSDSNAALAKGLGLPVVLVFDVRGMTRTAAALLLGLRAFDPSLSIAGVILNRVGGSRHEEKVRAALERYCPFPVLGALPRAEDLFVRERHLGLVPAAEEETATRRVEALAQWVAAGVDTERIWAAAVPVRGEEQSGGGAEGAVSPPDAKEPGEGQPAMIFPLSDRSRRWRVGVAIDAAFHFYYPEDQELFAALGVELVPFDTLRDRRLPACDALWLGGGFPESVAEGLAANQSLRREVRAAAADGVPVYAECGGLIYLATELVGFEGDCYEMCGVLPLRVQMEQRPVGRGYVRLEPTKDHPWTEVPAVVRAHEFHHSRAIWVEPVEARFAWRVMRGYGVDGVHDGIVWRRVLASYAHLRSLADWSWVVAWWRSWGKSTGEAGPWMRVA